MGQYRAGTVTVTSNSATIFGSGTTWITSGIQPGHWFSVREQGLTYTVAAVLAEDQLVLTGAYQGTTQTGVFYLLHTDFTPRGYAVPGPGDVDATVIVRRAIYDIDADMTRSVGGSGGVGGTLTMSSITNLNSSTALTGQVLVKQADGNFGFTSPASLGVTILNMTASAAGIGQIYAGTNTSGGHQFRAIQVIGGTLAQNADRLTITVPSGGEINTLSSLANAQSISIVAPKTGTTLNTYGLRGVNGITVVRDVNDIVISGTGTGGGGTVTGGEANTAENIGAAGTNVVRPFADKLNISLRFRTMLFNTDHFTVTGEQNNQYIINLRRQRLADSPDTDLSTAAIGNVLRLENDRIWRGVPMPAPGISSLQADPNPRLGGDLVTSGRRVLGLPDTISGQIERPKTKTYTLMLKSAHAFSISSMAASCATGTITFILFLGSDDLDDTPGGQASPPISGVATNSGVTEVIPGDAIQVPVGSRLSLRLSPSAANSQDFTFSIAASSA